MFRAITIFSHQHDARLKVPEPNTIAAVPARRVHLRNILRERRPKHVLVEPRG